MSRPRLKQFVCFFVGLALSASSAAAQNGAQAAPKISQTSTTKVMPVPVKIASGDLLEVSVFDSPELTQQVRIGSDGKAQLALIGNIPVAGLTGQEAGELIARELRERHFLLAPQVSVLIKEYATQGVSVTGEVLHPGVYQVLGPRTLLDVVSMAGGLTNTADTRITIKRRSGEDSITVKLKNDDVQSALANDVQIYPGDLILVPRAGIVYVLGDVTKPGGFVMQDNGKITLLQAMAQAGGAAPTASINKAVLLRKNGEGYTTSKLQVGKISKGEEGDVELHANDIVFLPNSRLKNALKNTQSMAETIGSASIYAVVH